MTTTPDHPSADDRAEAAVDELARRSASAVRRPAPSRGIESVMAAGARRRRTQTGVAVGGVAVLALATLAFTRGGDEGDTITVDTSPPSTALAPTPVSPTTVATTTTEATTTTTVPIDPSLSWALDFTGGPGGVATGEPVGIGLAGYEGSIARATVDLVNAELGGVNGRPVELVQCEWTDGPGAASCGQQFAADPTLSLVISQVDPAEFRDALGADVPRIGGFLVGQGAGITYYPSFGSQMFALTDVITRERPDADKVAFLGVNPLATLLTPLLPGVELVDAFGDPSSSTAIVESIRAAGAEDADVFVLVLPTMDCSPLGDAMTELGSAAMVVTDMCTNREDGWFYVDVPFNPDDPSEEWGARQAVDLLARRGVELVTPTDPMGFGSSEFGDVMDAVKILNALGDAPEREDIRRALAAFTGPAALSGPQDCLLQQASAVLSLGCARFVQILTVENGRFVTKEPVEMKP